MDIQALAQGSFFKGIPSEEVSALLEKTPHRTESFQADERIFLQMDPADRIGIVLTGRVQAQKTFPSGSLVNVSIRLPGDLIGPAAVFSRDRRYPCDVTALEPSWVMILYRDDLLWLMQQDLRILENFTEEISTATYMLQQRIELFSYHGIAQKAAFWLLLRYRQSGNRIIPIPDSVSKWALLMNVSRPSLHRELKRMEERGLIRCSSNAIKIIDAKQLHDLLGR